MKKIALSLLTSAALLCAGQTITYKNLEISPILKLTTKAEKELYDNGSKENMDSFYGRVTLGAKAKINNFETKVAFLAYPAGFGYELLRGIETADDTIGTTSEKIAKFQVDHATVSHHGKLFDLTIGRLVLFNSNGDFYGNYIDEGPGGYFTGKGVSANVVQMKSTYKIGATQLDIGTQDPKLNTGYFRLFQDINAVEGLHFGLGFRSNFLDKVHADDADVLWNATAVADYTIKEKVKLFVEAGFTNMSKDTDTEVPLVFGVKFPTKPVFDLVALELEYLKEDQRPDLAGKTLSPVQMGLHLQRDVGEHFTFKAGLFTLREISEMGLGIRLDAAL